MSQTWISGWYRLPDESQTHFLEASSPPTNWENAQKWLHKEVENGRCQEQWNRDPGFDQAFAELTSYVVTSRKRGNVRPFSFQCRDSVRCYYLMWDGHPQRLYVPCEKEIWSLPPVTDPRLVLEKRTNTQILTKITD